MTSIVVLSGGLDSTSALAITARAADTVRTISFDYGQRHARELDSARAVAAHYGFEHKVIRIPFMHGSALLGASEVPEGHYAKDTMAETVVNGRNLLFASVAIADAQPGDTIVFGVHSGDHFVYPDCRPEFWRRLAGLALDAYGVTLATPFLNVSKAAALMMGASAAAPLALSWSCYKGGDMHCGRCGTCVERAEAFHLARLLDPTSYEDPDYWRSAVAEHEAARS